MPFGLLDSIVLVLSEAFYSGAGAAALIGYDVCAWRDGVALRRQARVCVLSWRRCQGSRYTKKNRSSVSESLDILNFFSHVFYGSNPEEDCRISWYNSYRVGLILPSSWGSSFSL